MSLDQALAIAALLFASSCAHAPAPQAVSIAAAASSTQPPPVEGALRRADTVRVDKTVTLDDCEWTIIEARDAGQKVRSNSEFNEEKRTTGRFVMVHFKLTNLGSKEEMMVYRPKIQDHLRREFDSIDMEGFYIPTHAHVIGLDLLQPRVPKECWTVIEVPADAMRLKFVVHGFERDSKQVPVDLGL